MSGIFYRRRGTAQGAETAIRRARRDEEAFSQPWTAAGIEQINQKNILLMNKIFQFFLFRLPGYNEAVKNLQAALNDEALRMPAK